MTQKLEQAVLGGGCFWCVEAVFQELEGVTEVQSGYTGGHVDRPTYEQICTATTGHIEIATVTFDPSVISYREILQVFFATHDPTTRDRQGNDVGPQYRSAIFWQDETQRDVALDLIRELNDDDIFGAPIVTEVREAERVWPAEDYHRDYFRRHPQQSYCAFVIAPKVAKLRKQFAHRLKSAAL
jgi:peptide-methionine (S)-S-oxide reductase